MTAKPLVAKTSQIERDVVGPATRVVVPAGAELANEPMLQQLAFNAQVTAIVRAAKHVPGGES